MKKAATHFLAMWDSTGLECIFNLTAYYKQVEIYEKNSIWPMLKGETNKAVKPAPPPLNLMLLRARVNAHRCYEVYEFCSFLSETTIRKLFKDDPQPIVNWIRENGYEVYSDHAKVAKKVIV